jgi:ubiquinol-cytochrome c reductase iron-sulfur subunit
VVDARLESPPPPPLSPRSQPRAQRLAAHASAPNRPPPPAPTALRASFFGTRDFASKITITNSNPDAAENLGSVDESYEHETERVQAGDVNRRAFAYMMVAGGTLAYASFARTAVLKFLDSMNASADVLALSSLELDVGSIAKGDCLTVKWRNKPVFVRHRTAEEISQATSVDAKSLRDPETDAERVVNEDWLIVLGVCTHLGCVPLTGQGEYDGWFCPCHGSHYDTSGRIRKGPAPLNLEVPEYSFLTETTVKLG